MRLLCLITLCFIACQAAAQDKLFFTDGKTRSGILVSVAKESVFFKDTDTSAVQKISQSELLMVENYRGVRYLFAAKAPVDSVASVKPVRGRNALGLQPFAILTGRGTLVYERFSKDDKIGLVIPVSITFDPIGAFYNSKLDTNSNAPRRIKGVNFIFGLDLNFYLGKHEHSKFFIGPRARYGSDLLLRDTEAYTLQTQVGWRYSSTNEKFLQHLSVGFGFAHILSSPLGQRISPKQSYGWYSLNYRVSIRW